MAEQRPDGQPDPGQQPGGENAPGSAVEPAQDSAPQQPDPEQLRQFEQFRQFQEFQQFQELQRRQQAQQDSGGELTTAQQFQPTGIPTQQLVRQPPESPRRKVPGWVRWLGKKIIGWLIFFLLLGLALTWAYNYFLGGDDSNSSENQANMGGGRYHTNEVLSTRPHVAVQKIYQLIAEDNSASADRACVRFDTDSGIQQKFARDFGYDNCHEAVLALGKEVTHVTNYSRSIYPKYYDPNVSTVRIDSCDFEISGGPALGIFTVSKVERGQWLITGHERGPKTCPAPATGSGGPSTAPPSTGN